MEGPCSPPSAPPSEKQKVYGYKHFKTEKEPEEGYGRMMRREILPNIKRGLSAPVLTQTSDVEGEINGLLTWDREVLKIPAAAVRRLNRLIQKEFEKRQRETMAAVDKSVYLARGSVVVGDVTLMEGCGVWYNAVIRGDEDSVVIGRGSNIQDNAVIHVDKGHPVRIGEGVTVGHGAILHGCTVGDNSLIGMGAIVLNDAVIGRDCIIGAGALVTGGTVIPDGSVAFGNPARVRKEAGPEGAASNRRNAAFYRQLAREALEKEKDHL